MKKLYFALAALFIGTSLNAQVYLSESWGGTSLTDDNAWTVEIATGANDWYHQSMFGGIAVASNGGSGESDTWLISPAMNLTGANSPTLNFRNASNFNGPVMELYVSTTYSGTGVPNLADWNILQFSLSTGGWSWEDSGPVDLSSYLSSATYIAFRYQGTVSTGSTWEVDNVVVSGSTGTISIYDIQYSTAQDGASPYAGASSTVEGIVVAESSTAFNNRDRGYWIADAPGAWNGIFVLDSVSASLPNIGDEVEVSGQIKENFDHTLFLNPSYIVLSTGNTLPAATVVSTADVNTEQYEGVLVQVKNANCTNADVMTNFGKWSVDDASGDAAIDDIIYEYTPTLGVNYDVTGVIYYTFSEFLILPRGIVDISLATAITENTKLGNVYPNPVQDLLNVELIENGVITLSDLAGKIVFKANGNKGFNEINTSTFSNGIYFLRVDSGLATKLVK